MYFINPDSLMFADNHSRWRQVHMNFYMKEAVFKNMLTEKSYLEIYVFLWFLETSMIGRKRVLVYLYMTSIVTV